jgi:ribonuclease J
MAATWINVKVHRGSNEIGGNCVEVATAKSRLIVDVGLPLSEMMDNRAPKRGKPDRDDLIRRGVILPIPGLFSPGPKIDGILLSHAHADHFGLIEQTLPEIPVYLTRGASKMLMSGSLFAGQNGLPRDRQKALLPGKPQCIGDFLVTAYLVDHSSYGSVAFLIEAGGKRIGQRLARRRGVRFGRPTLQVDTERALELRKAGLSWRDISAEVGVAKDTLIRRCEAQ